MTRKPKPCPFCGHEKLQIGTDNYDSGGGWGQDTVFVECPCCDARGPSLDGNPKNKKDKTEAIKLWNLAERPQ